MLNPDWREKMLPRDVKTIYVNVMLNRRQRQTT